MELDEREILEHALIGLELKRNAIEAKQAAIREMLEPTANQWRPP